MSDKILIISSRNFYQRLLINNIQSIYYLNSNCCRIKIKDKEYELINLTGIDSVYDVLNKGPKLIIQCIDSINLEVSLLLTAQLLELNMPLIIPVNIMEDKLNQTACINHKRLESILGVPVIETIISQNMGIKEVFNKIEEILCRNGNDDVELPNTARIKYKHVVEEGLENIRDCFGSNPPSRTIETLLLSGNKQMESLVIDTYGYIVFKAVKREIKEAKNKTSQNLSLSILESRKKWARSIVINYLSSKKKLCCGSFSEKIGWLTRHPVWGWPVLAGFIYLSYVLIARIAAGKISGLINTCIFNPAFDLIRNHIHSVFIKDFLIGNYGILSMGLQETFATAFPLVLMFVFILGIMENSGYFNNICVLGSRFSRSIGIGGKSILPLMLGFGCSAVASLAGKILKKGKKKCLAVLLVSFAIPGTPQLGMILGLLGSPSFRTFLSLFMVLMFMELVAGVILNKAIGKSIPAQFFLEISPIKFPVVKSLVNKLAYMCKWFVKEVPLLYMAGAIGLFVLDKTGGMDFIKNVVSPVIAVMFSLDSPVAGSFLVGLLKQSSILLLLKLSGDKNSLTFVQSLLYLTIIMLIPSLENISEIVKEFNYAKTAAIICVIMSLVICVPLLSNKALKFAAKYTQ